MIDRRPPSIPCTPAEARAMVDAAKTGASVTVYRAVEPVPRGRLDPWDQGLEIGDVVVDGNRAYVLKESRGANKRAAGELTTQQLRCPYGKPGDVLGLKESWRLRAWDCDEGIVLVEYSDSAISEWMEAGDDGETWIENATLKLPAGYEEDADLLPWRSPVTMPAWAVRLTLRVGAVSVVQQQGEWRWALTGTVTPKGASRGE
jgi:hypothetical protein